MAVSNHCRQFNNEHQEVIINPCCFLKAICDGYYHVSPQLFPDNSQRQPPITTTLNAVLKRSCSLVIRLSHNTRRPSHTVWPLGCPGQVLLPAHIAALFFSPAFSHIRWSSLNVWQSCSSFCFKKIRVKRLELRKQNVIKNLIKSKLKKTFFRVVSARHC